ncbi:MAG TPA: acyl-CoA dehydrogenase family protein [Solirubrobacteraceae bacterium]|nr:acyl-CoA dehydrogenase family protein [Solirubrobacteraceae bacterium]
MATIRAANAPLITHEVENQPPPLSGRNIALDDRPMLEAVEREGGAWALDRITADGAFWGGEPQRWGVLANERTPVLRTHDRYGNRVDHVEFDESWHHLTRAGIERELHALPWRTDQEGAHVVRSALFMLAGQAEAGFLCPVTMTYAVVPALRAQPELAAEWEPLITATTYDPDTTKTAADKGSAICGMAMTEKQGGSDVRANTTVAVPLNGGGSGAEYEITGHKFFCSAPMSDLFLILAQTDEGLSCFALPRILPDGTPNAIRVQRLKDKLGNRSNASSEVEYHGAIARMVGEPGRGVPTIIEMVGHTRLDCLTGAASGMRAAVNQATWHTSHRAAFGRTLSDQPLMRNVLADLAIESEATTAMALRMSRAYDRADADPREAHMKRLGTAVGKYYACKRAVQHSYEALECFGGVGFVEESGMPRLYREAPLNSIWEGSGNVMALDVLRALSRTPEALEVFFAELDLAAGADPRLDAFVDDLRGAFADTEAIEHRARRVVEDMAKALQGSLVVRHAPPAVADAFCAARLAGDAGLNYGTLPAGVDVEAIIERHTPAAAAS